jgi:hypothetical protein
LTELSPLELLEQAVALLRAVPSVAWNEYVLGAAPLLVVIVYSVARASVHPMAAEEIGVISALLTALFFWRSRCKIRFARALHAQLAATGDTENDAPRGLWGAASLQGTKLIIIPLSLLAVFPFAWSVAFYGNLTALAKRTNPIRESARMAGLWRRQNWVAIALVAVFAIIVFLNIAILLFTLPIMARTFSGYENEFTRNPAAMLNATFFATAAGVTWFVISPLLQAMYVVRCFKGESLRSGADLRAALRRLAVGLALVCLNLHARPVTPAELDSKIRHTLKSPEYSWQIPEEIAANDSPRWMRDVIQFAKWVRHGIRIAMEWIGARLREWFHSEPVVMQPGKKPPETGLRWAIYAALVLIAIVALLLLRRALSAKKTARPGSPTAIRPLDRKGDLLASELPEDEWMRLAREALDRGDLRVALRAAYLANLAWLGSAGLVAISKFKSNRDYEREVRLRSRSDEITSLLRSNREVFESAWYGDACKTREDVERIQRNLVRMRELAHA